MHEDSLALAARMRFAVIFHPKDVTVESMDRSVLASAKYADHIDELWAAKCAIEKCHAAWLKKQAEYAERDRKISSADSDFL